MRSGIVAGDSLLTVEPKPLICWLKVASSTSSDYPDPLNNIKEHALETYWYGDEQATLGDRIAAVGEAASLSPNDLAQRMGVRGTTVHAWEYDQAEPRGNRLQMLAGMLNVPLTWLMTGEGKGVVDPDAAAQPLDVSRGLQELSLLRQGISQAMERIDRLEAQLRSASHLEPASLRVSPVTSCIGRQGDCLSSRCWVSS